MAVNSSRASSDVGAGDSVLTVTSPAPSEIGRSQTRSAYTASPVTVDRAMIRPSQRWVPSFAFDR
jgi:hypothetical protein